MSEPLRVLIVDDHPIFRDGLRALLAATPGNQVVGEAEDGDAAVTLTEQLEPDVVLMDLRMPGRSGIEATRAIIDRRPDAAVLLLTMQDDDASVFQAMRAGARGYLLKDVDREELVRAIETVAAGGAVFGPGVARRMITFFARGAAHAAEPFPELTQREREVLDRIARGENNAVIAARLGISLKTVRNHSSTIFDKLMVADRGQAIIRAREAGLGSREGRGG
jgi:DNA-binding NarL/FixJ family response regulator